MTLDVPISPNRPAGALTGSVARVGARTRLDHELRSIAADLLGSYASDELPAECSAWLRATIESAVAGVRDASLASLVDSLETELAAAPPGVARRLDEARIRHDAGFI